MSVSVLCRRVRILIFRRKGGRFRMNEYRGKHAPSTPWAVASTATVPVRRGRHLQKSRRRKIRVFILLALLAILLAYPFVEAKIIRTEKTLIKSADLPADANHLRIVFVSDIHWGFWFSDGELERLIAKVNGLRPDLVLFGGDYAMDHDSALRFFTRLQNMPKIHARYGIYGVPGETDCGVDEQDRDLLLHAMDNAGITPLFNDVVFKSFSTGRICIAGLDDIRGGRPDIASVASRVSAGDFVILVAHNPSLIPEIQLVKNQEGTINWYDIGFFGHTHGGQMLFFSNLLGIADDVPSQYHQARWYPENKVPLLISPGVGTSVFPARLFCSPAIHLIEVTTGP